MLLELDMRAVIGRLTVLLGVLYPIVLDVLGIRGIVVLVVENSDHNHGWPAR